MVVLGSKRGGRLDVLTGRLADGQIRCKHGIFLAGLSLFRMRVKVEEGLIPTHDRSQY